MKRFERYERKTTRRTGALALGLAAGLLALSLAGCGGAASQTEQTAAAAAQTEQTAVASRTEQAQAGTQALESAAPAAAAAAALTAEGGALDGSSLFSDRDLAQTADTADAIRYTVSDGQDIRITAAGTYVLTGSASDVTVWVEADSEAKVQLVLEDLSITNSDFPCIYVKQAGKVFLTLTGENALSVTGAFRADGSTNTDGVIFSRDDLTLNGTGSLRISSTDNGIVGKDDVKFTGGAYDITAASKAVEANDSIRVAGGDFTLTAGSDGLHAENGEDDSVGYVYISGGSFSIRAGDDGVHAVSLVQIDGGSLDIVAAEGIEGTYVQLNDGTVNIQAGDDGVNAARKSGSYPVLVEINGGALTIVMGQGDTDGIDSNGDIVINGGVIDITGQSATDYDGSAQLNGGTLIINGETVNTIPNQMIGGPGGMMGGGRGGWGGGPGGAMGGGPGGWGSDGAANGGRQGRTGGRGM